MANSGWGDGAWGSSFWGGFQDLDLTLTGVSGTSTVGQVTAVGISIISPTGEEVTTSLGSVVAGAGAVVAVSGLEATGKMSDGWGDGGYGLDAWGGTTSVDVGQDIVPTGLSAEAILGPKVVFAAQADAAISTDQSKFGGSSLELDGTGDRVQSTDITLGTDSYTWETFAYFNDLSSSQCIWDAGENIGASQNPVLYVTSAGDLQLTYAGGLYIRQPHGMSTGQWHHIAIVRDGTQLEAFIDGTSIGTATYTGGSGATNHVLGGNYAGTFTMDGYLDESRLTKRVIYTGNFTPPTQAFSPDTNDIWLLHYDGADGSTDIENSAAGAKIEPTGDANLDLTGVSSTGQLGTVLPGAGAIVEETGLEGSIGFGDEQVFASANVFPTGLSATSALGDETAFTDIIIPVTGQSATGSIGDVFIRQSRDVQLTGFGTVTSLNSVSITGNADVLLTSVSGTGNIGTMFIWGRIAPAPTAIWSEVAA